MKIKIHYIEKNDNADNIEFNNHIALYLFGIKIKKISLNRKIHSKAKSKNNKVVNTIFMIIKQILKSLEKEEIVNIVGNILKTIKIKRLDLKLGINLENILLNVYSIAIINAIIPIALRLNNKNIDLKHIKYETYISQKVIDLHVDSIIHISITKNIVSIIKIIFLVMKGGIKNGNKTSNRISNDNINDLNRKYGRC